MGGTMAKKNEAEDGEEETIGVEDQIDLAGWGNLQTLAYLAAFLFIVSDGMELIVTNVTFRAMPQEKWGMDDTNRGYLISASFMGFVVGGLVGGFVADQVGRRTMLYVHTAIFLPFTICSGLSQDYETLMLARLFVGLSMGIVLPTSVAYFSELCPTSYRGRAIGSLPMIGFTMGEVIVLLVGLFFMRIYGETDCGGDGCDWWRWMMVAGVFPDIIAVSLVFFFLPESPRFLLARGRVEEAEKAVRYIAEFNGASDKLAGGGRLTPVLGGGGEDPRKLFLELFEAPLRDNLVLVIVVWSLLSLPLFGMSFSFPILLEKQFDVSPSLQFMLMIPFVMAESVGIAIAFLMIDNTGVGRKRTIAAFEVSCVVLLGFAAYVSDWSLSWVVWSYLLLKVVTAAPYNVMYVWATELLPTTHRNQGLSIGNSSTKFVGGVVLPVLLTALVIAQGMETASRMSFAGYVAACVIVVAIVLNMGRETVGRVMTDVADESQDDSHLLLTERHIPSGQGYEPLQP